jgi:ribonuclease D
MFKTNITKEEINLLDILEFKGKIHLIEDLDAFSTLYSIIENQAYIGFDTESKPNFVKGEKNKVAMIQIAIPDNVFLFRLNKIGFAQELVDILENEKIRKVGVAIKNDARELQSLKQYKPKGFLELPDLSSKFGIQANGLRSLAAVILNGRISKSAKITNWEAEFLTEKQLIYAATDAWACLKMYERLKEFELYSR